ncbi:Rossmann-like domain-containing protein [Chloroflexota bacterium]
MALKTTIEEAKEKFQKIIAEHRLGNEPVEVTIGTLTARQAIGDPIRQDFPLLEGREVMIEAQFKGSAGQAFTDRPHEFKGSLNDVLNLELDTNDARAIFDATLNAVMAQLGMVTGVRHCRDEEPEECAAEIAKYILTNYGKVKVGLVGYQPAIFENLVKALGAENVHCTDLNPKNIGSQKYGAEVWDGKTDTERLIGWCDVMLATSSTIVNDTFDSIKAETDARGKKLIIFGVTGAGVSALLGLERLCFQPH